jgi:hypothetical protein
MSPNKKKNIWEIWGTLQIFQRTFNKVRIHIVKYQGTTKVRKFNSIATQSSL